DHARSYRIHPDAVRANLLREADGERVDGALGGGVVHVLAGAAEARGDRGNVDDGAALAAMAGRHALHGLARAEEASRDVDREHALQPLGAHRLDAHAAVDDAGVVHEDVEAPERALRLVEEPQDIRLDGDVARDGMGLPARALDVAAKRLRGGGIAQVIDADGVAARGGEPRGGRADAAATARDQHDL